METVMYQKGTPSWQYNRISSPKQINDFHICNGHSLRIGGMKTGRYQRIIRGVDGLAEDV